MILQGHGAYPELTKGYVEGIVGVVSALVNSVEMDDDPERKLWFIADELGQMGKIPIRPLFEVGRSRGVRCVVACQDLAQLEEIHGTQMVKALVSMSGSILVGQMMQGDTAEQMSKALGAREVERANLSSSYAGAGGSSNKSTTLSFARDEMSTYKPAELALRLGKTPDGAGVKLVLFTEGNAYELFWPMFAMGTARNAHVPAKWTTAAGRVAASDAAAEVPPQSTWPAKVMAAADSSDSLRDDGDRREDAERGKSLDGDAAAGPAPSLMATMPLGEETAQLMRDSLEVVSQPQPTGAHAGDIHEPLAEAATHAIASALGFAPLGSAANVAMVADLALDARPGPVNEVRQTQQLRALLSSAAVSTLFANASTAPRSSK
ncbi:MAG: type IV secretion system DNA-binding domain-containing protein [Rubrivivax sp.]